MIPDSALLLVANLLSCVLFGLYGSVAVRCARIFASKRRANSSANCILVICFALITILVTAKIIIDCVMTVTSLLTPTPDGIPQYPSADSPLILSLNAIWVLLTFISDSFVIYRTWVIWRRDWRPVVLPIILSAGCLGGGISCLWTLVRLGEANALPSYKQHHRAVVAFLSTTLALNVLCTGLIASRIWFARRHLQSIGVSTGTTVSTLRGSDPVKNACVVVVESAMVYTIILLVDLTFTASGTPLILVTTPLVAYVIALVFGVIIVRAANGNSVENTMSNNACESVPPSSRPSSCGPQRYSVSQRYSISRPSSAAQGALERAAISRGDTAEAECNHNDVEKRLSSPETR